MSVEEVEPEAPEPARRADSLTHLIESARECTQEALDGWLSNKGIRETMLPVAVELLGKALLWSRNPLLVASEKNPNAIIILAADQPDIRATGVRTIGLEGVFGRVQGVTGNLKLPQPKIKYIAQVRNGFVHTGTREEARSIVVDCLVVLSELLDRLGHDRDEFFGVHAQLVEDHLDEKKTEIGRQVAVKIASAKQRMDRFEAEHGNAAFARWVKELSDEKWDNHRFTLYGSNGALTTCPACEYEGLIVGEVDAGWEPDWDVERGPDGEWEPIYSPALQLTLQPASFECNVCRLDLDIEELAETDLPTATFDVELNQLHPHFNLDMFIRDRLYDE